MSAGQLRRHRSTSRSSSKRDEKSSLPPPAPSITPKAAEFEPCAATASFFLYAQRNVILCLHHDTLAIERRLSLHREDVAWIAVDNVSERGAGRLVVSYDVGNTAIVWDLLTGDEVARFAAYEQINVATFMRNGNVAFGNAQGNVILFEPSTSEHISARTIFDPITALAPAADCRTFAIGFQNGSILIVTLQPAFTILHTLTTPKAPSPIINLAWHGSSSKQKSEMLATQTSDGDLRVWSVPKAPHTDPPCVIRILNRSENRETGPCWFGWSKNGRIVQHSEGATYAWDVRTKKVTYDVVPTIDGVTAIANFGPGATLFTLGRNHTVQQYDLNPSQNPMLVANVQHVPANAPPSPPNSIEEKKEHQHQEEEEEEDELLQPQQYQPQQSQQPQQQQERQEAVPSLPVYLDESSEVEHHPSGSASGVLLSKWLGDNGADLMASMIGSESMTSSDWMLLALCSMGQNSQRKLGEAFVQRLLEKGDIHPAVAILLGLGELNEAVEVYVARKYYLEATILTCLLFPNDWQRQSFLVRKWAGPNRVKQSGLKLFTSFNEAAGQSGLSAGGDRTAQGITPIAQSALSPGGGNNWLHPGARSAREPSSARTATPGGYGRKRFPSKPDYQRGTPIQETPIVEGGETPYPTTAVKEPESIEINLSVVPDSTHSRQPSIEVTKEEPKEEGPVLLSAVAVKSAKIRSIDQYISSLEEANYHSRKASRSRAGSKDRVGRTSRQSGRETSQTRGRSGTRYIKPAKRSPSSPVPMSPEEAAMYSSSNNDSFDDERYYKVASPAVASARGRSRSGTRGTSKISGRSLTDLGNSPTSYMPPMSSHSDKGLPRSHTADPEMMRYNPRHTTGTSTRSMPIGLPATPRALRHPRYISSDPRDRDEVPAVPQIPEHIIEVNVDNKEVHDDVAPLLPATTFGQTGPQSPQRSASAPPEHFNGSRRESVSSRGSGNKRISPPPITASIDETLHGDQIIVVGEPEAKENPPLLAELQHLAAPPPPPPPPMYHSGHSRTGSGVINIAIDENPSGRTTTPAMPPPIDIPINDNLPSRPQTGSPHMHRRGRGSVSESIGSRLRGVTERMRSTSRSRAKSPPNDYGSHAPSPYETVIPGLPVDFGHSRSNSSYQQRTKSPLSESQHFGDQIPPPPPPVPQMGSPSFMEQVIPPDSNAPSRNADRGYMRHPREVRANMPPEQVQPGVVPMESPTGMI
ncbi:putative wd g-beta repeat protein [Neofusicoccum parvum UCRNP2]|uniref:Putative wd g-beta repeat protein n=1 Tax=Botryosphaeria parva (strain UCR-NP2) TaxID=1287680 RepID=R1GFS1_BOTPV|nr:putative wd g-beta repeat protein [Neofusicoccum parvum UCRNP2]